MDGTTQRSMTENFSSSNKERTIWKLPAHIDWLILGKKKELERMAIPEILRQRQLEILAAKCVQDRKLCFDPESLITCGARAVFVQLAASLPDFKMDFQELCQAASFVKASLADCV